MDRARPGSRRGDAPVVGVLLLVAVVVVLAATTSGYVLSDADGVPPPAPRISVSHETVADGTERTVAVTLTAGDAVRTDRLYVEGSKPIDVGGAPGSATPADETYASSRETLVESPGDDPPQVGIGETWDAGETVYLDPVGSVEALTVRIYWNTRPVEGINPGTVTGDDAYEIAAFTV
jgi:flagellin-like protein